MLALTRFAALLVASLLAACGAPTRGAGFGAPYSLVESPVPRLDGDMLRVAIVHQSCGASPTLSVHGERAGDEARVWLRNDSPRAPCDMADESAYDLLVPAWVASAKQVVLAAPSGVRIRLR
jgi:hypothetical protein